VLLAIDRKPLEESSEGVLALCTLRVTAVVTELEYAQSAMVTDQTQTAQHGVLNSEFCDEIDADRRALLAHSC
jgi:hypothetical protein